MRHILTLFRGSATADARAPYEAIIAEARQPDWYRAGRVEDTRDGRFAVLASLVALAILRLEDGGEEAVRGAVLLTEEFIDDMDAQMRQEGFGDPGLGKQVRGLVGALAARVDRWRKALAGEAEWQDAAAWSVYRDKAPCEEALTYSSERLRRFHERLAGSDDEDIMEGSWR